MKISNPFAESSEGQYLLEKCRVLGKSPAEIQKLSEVEDVFLSLAITKKYKRMK
jgi:hypothetical protein